MLRAVMDTNVLDSAFRSRLGYSFDVFVALRRGQWRAVVSNHLVHEYEEIPKRHATDLGLSLDEIDALLDALCARAEEWQLALGWLPILPDPDDEPLAQLAYDSGARRIMNVIVQLPDSLAAQAREFARREHISMDAFVASALTAQLDHTPHRPTIAARVDWGKVDAILARVPAVPPTPGDER